MTDPKPAPTVEQIAWWEGVSTAAGALDPVNDLLKKVTMLGGEVVDMSVTQRADSEDHQLLDIILRYKVPAGSEIPSR